MDRARLSRELDAAQREVGALQELVGEMLCLNAKEGEEEGERGRGGEEGGASPERRRGSAAAVAAAATAAASAAASPSPTSSSPCSSAEASPVRGAPLAVRKGTRTETAALPPLQTSKENQKPS